MNHVVAVVRSAQFHYRAARRANVPAATKTDGRTRRHQNTPVRGKLNKLLWPVTKSVESDSGSEERKIVFKVCVESLRKFFWK